MNIIWKRPDGGVSVTHVIEEMADAALREHAAELQRLGSIPGDYEMVATAIDLPASREWREAWSWTTPDPVIDICPVRAKQVTKERLRKERAPLLAALDVQFQRALETGADTATIVAEKNRLRDITNHVDSTETLEALAGLKA